MTPKRSVSRHSPRSSEPIVEAISLTCIGKRAIRPDMDDLINELEDADLAYLTVWGVRALKRRLTPGDRTGAAGPGS